jgi:PIN domain nuclease of toxin-antitoxin system
VEGDAVTRFLFDTHTWIWALAKPDRFPSRVRKQLENTSNELYLSPVSIWEAHHLSKRRRIRHKGTFQQWLDAAFQALPLRDAPFNFAVGTEASRLHLDQSDFGDLFLAATAVVFNLTLVTTDAQLIAHPSIKTLRADS